MSNYFLHRCIHKQKELLFEPLTLEAAKMGKHKLQVLELGGGAGSNFAHVKEPVTWTVTEPNKEFAPYFDQTVKEKGGQHRISELKEACGEDLGQFAPESFDAVVVSVVLCSVSDVGRVLKEILRVLKKGGKFYFVEHVAAERGTWLRYYQLPVAVKASKF